MRKIYALAAVAALSACAQSPGSIAPISMPPTMYDSYTCEQVRVEHSAVASRLAALESSQKGAVVGDTVGVILIGVPVSSLVGGDKSGQIATEKGRLIVAESRMSNC